jgi:hypothetical protein
MAVTTQEDVTYCGVHEDREATLRCIRCERYMCTRCIVQTPVGYICQQCARKHDDKFFDGTNLDDGLIFATTAVLTGIGAAIVSSIGIPFFFLLILGLPIGGAIGEAVLRITKKRHSRYSHYVSAAGCVVGGFIGAGIQLLTSYNNALAEAAREAGISVSEFAAQVGASASDFVVQGLTSDFSLLLFIGITALAVYGRYKLRA